MADTQPGSKVLEIHADHGPTLPAQPGEERVQTQLTG